MLFGWLIYSEKDAKINHSYIDWFIDEAKHQGIELELVLRESLVYGIIDHCQTLLKAGKQAKEPDFAVVRTIDPLLSEFLEQKDIKVFNSSFVSRIANDKALTHLYMNKLGIPMVNTLFIRKDLVPDVPPLAYPFVLKKVHSRGGKDVDLIHNAGEWHHQTRTYAESDLIIQETDVQHGRDVRVFIVGTDIIGAVLRKNDTDFRANFKLGGTVSIYNLNQEEQQLITAITSRFDFGMVGIDFLVSSNGKLLFNEIEDIVGSRTLSATSHINILERYITHIKNHLQS